MELRTGWDAMRAKLSNYCLTWEQLYLAENPWVAAKGEGEEARFCQVLSPHPLQLSHDKVKFVSKLSTLAGRGGQRERERGGGMIMFLDNT